MAGTGSDDYIWMDKDGVLTLYQNFHNPPWWRPLDVIYSGVGALRDDVYLADLDNDKKCDYLVVDPTNGEVRMIKNNGLSDGKFTWTDKGKVFNGGVCAPPNKIVFADLNGDGMVISFIHSNQYPLEASIFKAMI